ncbi:hypothetical protein GCM10007872_25250 [Gluconobacter sphaericus NBRC 12467]|uniref:Glycosyltransferase 2-like domain-containing protein n=2 Tax=Gluconobacter sphaericus TaxID=574987 RepID=A0AA37SI07_9PROT|nr:O-antigen biosynthesis protein RfbC [Gluconobacter sphaericus NBRC 12467]GEB43437.1 hypothetical protein GSP01_22190 [Gluconobacter sphaericus NBRC 12467]GLQ85615.1 hypothetical protein GCM10007872_25250 [Gluconobacter sphaericus NBRC 12467]
MAIADLPRADIQAMLSLPTANLGFSFQIPSSYFNGEKHTLSLRLDDRSALPLLSDGVTSITFSGHLRPSYKSHVDGVKQGALRGWVLRKSRDGEETGGVVLSILVDGIRIGQIRANRYRGDVAAVLGCDPNCGFEFPIPQALRGSRQHTVKVLAQPDDIELDGCPIVTSFADDAFESRIIDVTNELDEIYRRMAKLRQELRDLVPKRSYTLGDYDRWARKYYTLLGKRMVEQRVYEEKNSVFTPLVSILCPVYRPLEGDFKAAVQSVLDQTYQNWELILVDDAGKSHEITKIINNFTKSDSRIQCITLKKNVGIAGATNVAMDAAKGQYVAFFDHDDLLVDVAIEVMVRAARETGAKLLYSDEDKIDQAGYYLEPNLKPDFNYRYLLGCNYICHLTMVDAATMQKIGHLNSDYNGAQDHDFVLKATEILSPSEIFHVPEILYHWRKTPNSTAVDVSQKTYAINAGVKCVADHLKRQKIASTVSSIRGLTLYGVEWTSRTHPSVTIIIPFKDQLDTTLTCVENILKHTVYKNYNIVLIDNWSVRDETLDFIKKIQKHKNVSVITVEEPFNFSRLNNIAVAQTRSDYVVFMNNDVFVEDPKWLQRMVGEAQAFKDVGAVGAKLLYPNDTIQHAGVVVGPAGVAAHVHRGDPLSEYGYIGRTMLSHEVTAVTAALMLVRRTIFDEVGGFDEEALKVAFNDVDLCLKIRRAGYRIIFSAETIAYHHESLSRGTDDKPEHETRFFLETQTMLERWSSDPLFERDPSYPRYFTVDQQTFFNLVDPEELP